MALLSLPYEIVSHIFLYLTIQDLARLERTCRNFQSWILYEIERRIKTCTLHDDWDILIHSGHVVVTPARFDIRTKKVFYSVPMDPIRIKTMYDHRRQIHCALSWSCGDGNNSNNSNNNKRRWTYDGLQIVLEEGMKEGITEQIDVQGKSGCELHASLTRLQQQQQQQQQYRQQYQQQLQKPNDGDHSDQQHSSFNSYHSTTDPINSIAPLPLIYSIQVDELSLPLSRLISVDARSMYDNTNHQ